MSQLEPTGPWLRALESSLEMSASRLGRFAGRTTCLGTVTSTNDTAARLAAGGAAEGTAVTAWRQTAGRGRRGRRWESPGGAGIYASVVLRPPTPMPLLTLTAGVALTEALRRLSGLPVEIKWPNDLLLRGLGTGRRKLAGILTECSGGPDAAVVLGFGINVLEAPPAAELSASVTSLEAALGRRLQPAAVLIEALVELERWYAALLDGRTTAILDRWTQLSPSCRGAAIELPAPGGPRRAITSGVDADGALRVTDAGGERRVVAGEIVWLQP